MSNDVLATTAQFPWAAVITGVAGVVGALSGAFLANFFSEKRWSKQIQHEQNKSHNDLMRIKGEETFLMLKRWGKELFYFNTARIQFVEGSISEEDMNKRIDEKVTPETHIKLDVLFSIYFSNLSADLEAIHKQTAKVNNLFSHYSQHIGSKSGAIHMIEEVAVYERQFEQLQKRLRIAVKEYL